VESDDGIRAARRPADSAAQKLAFRFAAAFPLDRLRAGNARSGQGKSGGNADMTAISGSAAAVTGAASGIGRALALELAARGCDVAVADLDEAGLASTAEEIRGAHQRKVSVHRLDVSSPEQIEAFAKAAVAAHPGLNIVVNNAGVALFGQFHEIEQAQVEWLMNINFWGVVNGTRAFLPHLQTRPEAHVVNLSSIFGIIAPAGQTAYCAAKFAVRGFSEALRHELQMNKSPVRLSVVHPGGVSTNIVRNARTGAGVANSNQDRSEAIDRFAQMAKTTPKGAAERIIRGIEKNEPRILIGNDARFLDLLQRFKPATYWPVLARRIEKTRAAAAKG
jgi:short-subunit dehydrogenase